MAYPNIYSIRKKNLRVRQLGGRQRERRKRRWRRRKRRRRRRRRINVIHQISVTAFTKAKEKNSSSQLPARIAFKNPNLPHFFPFFF